MVDPDPRGAFGCTRRPIRTRHLAGQHRDRARPVAELRFVGGVQVGAARQPRRHVVGDHGHRFGDFDHHHRDYSDRPRVRFLGLRQLDTRGKLAADPTEQSRSARRRAIEYPCHGRDTKSQVRRPPEGDAREAWRLYLSRCEGQSNLRRQGGAVAEPCAVVLRLDARIRGEDAATGRADRGYRFHPYGHRPGGAVARGDAAAAAPAVLQRAPQRRQALPVPEDRPQGAMAASRDYEAGAERRGALLRPVRLGGVGAADAGPRQEAVPVAVVHEGDHRRRSSPVSRVLHPPLRRAVRFAVHEGGVRHGHPADDHVPRGPHGRDWAGPAARDAGSVGSSGVRASCASARPSAGDRADNRAAGDGGAGPDGHGRLRPGARGARGVRAGLVRA